MKRDRKRGTVTLAVPPPVGMARDEGPHLAARYFHACRARQTITEQAAMEVGLGLDEDGYRSGC